MQKQECQVEHHQFILHLLCCLALNSAVSHRWLISSSAARRLLLPLQRSFGGGGWLAADVAGSLALGRTDGRLNKKAPKTRQRLRAKRSFGWTASVVVAVTSEARLTPVKASPAAGLGHQGQFNSKNHTESDIEEGDR